MKSAQDPRQVHRECWEALAWAANGTLRMEEHGRVEAHLRACEHCRAELELQQRVREAMRADDAVVLAPQTSFQKLMQRIDAEDAALVNAPRTPRSTRIVGRTRWLAAAAALQAAALIFVAATYWRATPNEMTAPRFQTLTEPVRLSGAVIRIVFAQDVSVEAANEVVRSIGAQVVAGPSEAGVYTLALQSSAATTKVEMQRNVDAALKELRADARVMFAEAAAVSLE